jgi:hypothetical protein
MFKVVLSTNQNPAVMPPNITKMDGVYAQEFISPPQGTFAQVNWTNLTNAVNNKALSEYLFLDIEHWDINKFQTPEVRAQSNADLRAVMEHAQALTTTTRIGWYGLYPLAEFWASILASQGQAAQDAELVQWRILNDANLAAHGPLQVLMPVLYHRNTNPSDWFPFAEAHIIEAQRLAAPTGAHVVPYLSPRTYISVMGELVESYPDPQPLGEHLQFLKDMGCQGAIVWNWEPSVPLLDDSINWWVQMKNFAATLS